MRELRNNLSTYLRRVKAGEVVTITDHGQEVGRIVPSEISFEERMKALAAAGVVEWNGQKLTPYTPVAIARMVRKGIVSREIARESLLRFRSDWAVFIRVPVSETLVARADDLAWQLGLRGYDAVHLAAALFWQENLGVTVTLATFDCELWKAAQVSGLQALPENFV